jgi:hypothetical protein
MSEKEWNSIDIYSIQTSRNYTAICVERLDFETEKFFLQRPVYQLVELRETPKSESIFQKYFTGR